MKFSVPSVTFAPVTNQNHLLDFAEVQFANSELLIERGISVDGCTCASCWWPAVDVDEGNIFKKHDNSGGA